MLLRGENTLSSAGQKQADQHFLKLSICLSNTHCVHAAPVTVLWSYKTILPRDLLHMVYNALSTRIKLWRPQHNSEVGKAAYFIRRGSKEFYSLSSETPPPPPLLP